MHPIKKRIREWTQFTADVARALPSAFKYRRETIKQMYLMGNQALPVVLLAAIFVSMVLALEWGKKLEPMGAKLMLGRLVSISVIREIGPMISGLMVAGRTGAKIVSEIGNMVLSEQIDALRAFGTDPIKRLIAPRILASLFIMLPMVIIADTLGVFAGWFASVFWMKIDSQFFWIAVRDGLFLKDLAIGLIKPPFFGFLIGYIAAFYGYHIKGGAEGMGKAAMLTVTFASLGVLITDFLITKVVLWFM